MSRQSLAVLLFSLMVFPSLAQPAGEAEKEPSPDAERLPEVADADLTAIDDAITELYASISGPKGQKRDGERFKNNFAEGARLIAMRPSDANATLFTPGVMTPGEYADRNMEMLKDVGFIEKETHRVLEVYGTIAHAFSTYEGKFTTEEGNEQRVKGINSIQLVKIEGEWKVMTILWDQEWPGGKNPVPERYLAEEINPQLRRIVHFMDPRSVMDEPQDVVSLTVKEFAERRNDVLLSTPEADDRRVRAGQCPTCEKFFPLIGHGQKPDMCPVCNETL